MSRGGSALRPLAERSAASAKGWATRKRQAAARGTAGLPPPQRGIATDRVLKGEDIAPLIARTIAALRAREAGEPLPVAEAEA